MLRRKIMEDLMKWKNNPDRKPLLIRGARQVGKTFIVNEFSKSYSNYIYINFETNHVHRDIFSGNLNIDALIRRISAEFIEIPLVPGKTLIFLDEIQNCPGARTALKTFALDRRFDVICSGSLLGLNYKEVSSYPVGYEETIEMYPLGFEEFLWALGMDTVLIKEVAEMLRKKEPLDPFVLSRIEEYFRWYMVVGGMPEVVRDFVKNKDIGRTFRIQKDILNGYMSDVSKYSKGVVKNRARECLLSVPEQTGGRFRYVDIDSIEKSGEWMYGGSLEWLSDAGIVFKCHNVTAPTLPLSFNRRFSVFKLFMTDTGLLVSMMEKGIIPELLKEETTVNKGKIAENAVAGELRRKGNILMYFEKKGRLEVDFVMNLDGGVAAVEVKSGDNKRSKSLDALSEKYNVSRRIKLENTNVYTDDRGTEHYPIFAAAFIFPDDSGYVL